MTKLKKHNGTKHPAVQQTNETEAAQTHAPSIGGHPDSRGGSRQGNIGHDRPNEAGGNRVPNE